MLNQKIMNANNTAKIKRVTKDYNNDLSNSTNSTKSSKSSKYRNNINEKLFFCNKMIKELLLKTKKLYKETTRQKDKIKRLKQRLKTARETIEKYKERTKAKDRLLKKKLKSLRIESLRLESIIKRSKEFNKEADNKEADKENKNCFKAEMENGINNTKLYGLMMDNLLLATDALHLHIEVEALREELEKEQNNKKQKSDGFNDIVEKLVGKINRLKLERKSNCSFLLILVG